MPDDLDNLNINLFYPSELEDFQIPWGDHEWKPRFDKIRGTSIVEHLHSLGVYWKFAWNTARVPWQTANFVEQLKGKGFAEKFWQNMRPNQEFALTVIGTQIMAFSGFYFAYEHFVTNCCRAKTGTTAELFGYWKIKEELEKAFGSPVETAVWSDREVEIARRLRNALAHNGGVPDEFLKQHAPEWIFHGRVYITPKDNEEIMRMLKSKVDILLEQQYPK